MCLFNSGYLGTYMDVPTYNKEKSDDQFSLQFSSSLIPGHGLINWKRYPGGDRQQPYYFTIHKAILLITSK